MPNTEDSTLQILALAGSLRRDSWNRRLLHAAATGAPAGLEVTVFEDLASVPLFSQDLEVDDPPPVRAFRHRIARADGILIATPEYNGAMPGVLKNALDWLSRPYRQSCLIAKPVAVTGTTPGSSGARSAQQDLRNILWNLKALVLPSPTLFIHQVGDRFDAAGTLKDAETREALTNFLSDFGSFIQWARRDRKISIPALAGSTVG